MELPIKNILSVMFDNSSDGNYPSDIIDRKYSIDNYQ